MDCICKNSMTTCTPCKMRAHQYRMNATMVSDRYFRKERIKHLMVKFEQEEWSNPSTYVTGSQLSDTLWFHADNEGCRTHNLPTREHIPAGEHVTCIAWEVAFNIEEYHEDVHTTLDPMYSRAVY